jgi:protein-S-isoprenylcysteine O-methyltransferase Ste14
MSDSVSVSGRPDASVAAPAALSRVASAVYGGVVYTIFFATFTYAIGFLGNLIVPKSIDSGVPGPFGPSLLVNVALLGLFGLQHSVMARPGFKALWTRIVPKQIERATFVLATCICLVLMYWQWRPMPQVVWTVESAAGRGLLSGLFAAGWLIVLLSTIMINHFDLFGLRQVYLHFQGKPYKELGFRVTGFYRYVRHPIMAGFLISFWSAPDMTLGRLTFAAVTTAYILVAVYAFEERDLTRHFGARYEYYKSRVHGLVPLRRYSPPARRPAVQEAMGD